MNRRIDMRMVRFADADRDWDDAYIHRLGNLCLLPGINHALGNKLFPEKVETYKLSRLETTKGLAAYSDWGRTQIVDRQRRMAMMAVRAWHFQ